MDSISDLGITFDSKLSFELYIDNQIVSVIELIGFVKRSTVDFRNSYSILYLYKSLVVLHLA